MQSLTIICIFLFFYLTWCQEYELIDLDEPKLILHEVNPSPFADDMWMANGSISPDGNYVCGGDRSNGSSGIGSTGKVHIFKLNKSNNKLEKIINIERVGGQFGRSCLIRNENENGIIEVLIGSPTNQSVFVYYININEEIPTISSGITIVPPMAIGGNSFRRFGEEIRAHNEIIAIGDYEYGINESGSVVVFRRTIDPSNDESIYTFDGLFSHSDTSLIVYYGGQIAIGGKIGSEIIVCGPRSGNQNYAHVYQYLSDQWTLIQTLIYPESNNGGFPADQTISSDATKLVIGSPNGIIEGNSGLVVGNAYYYKWNSLTQQFDLIQKFLRDELFNSDGSPAPNSNAPPRPASAAQFGYNLRMSANGSRLYIAARDQPSSGFSRTGALYVYEYNSSNDKYDYVKIIEPDPAGDELLFGLHVEVDASGTQVMSTAFNNVGALDNQGAMYYYQFAEYQAIDNTDIGSSFPLIPVVAIAAGISSLTIISIAYVIARSKARAQTEANAFGKEKTDLLAQQQQQQQQHQQQQQKQQQQMSHPRRKNSSSRRKRSHSGGRKNSHQVGKIRRQQQQQQQQQQQHIQQGTQGPGFKTTPISDLVSINSKTTHVPQRAVEEPVAEKDQEQGQRHQLANSQETNH